MTNLVLPADATIVVGAQMEGSVSRSSTESTSGATTTAADPLPAREEETEQERGEEKWIWVLDPMTRKLRVPAHLIIPTQATVTSGTVPSLCIAYLEGRCRYPWCRQAHVLPAAIPLLRMEAQNAPTCCRLHNDPHDISRLTTRFRYIRITNNGLASDHDLIPTNRIASTVGLLRYLVHNVPPKKDGVHAAAAHSDKTTWEAADEAGADHQAGDINEDEILELPAKFICRLHLAHRCRYLEDCNNIHLCREFESRLQPPPHVLSSLAAVTGSTRTVTVGDTCYSVTPLVMGEVSDDEFNMVAEEHRKSYQQGSAHSTPLWSAASVPHDTASHANSLDAADAAVPRSGAASLNPYAASFLASAGAAATDTWPAVPTTPSLLSYSPTMGSMSVTNVPHLRVYDVTGKSSPPQGPHRHCGNHRPKQESAGAALHSPATLPTVCPQMGAGRAMNAVHASTGKDRRSHNPSTSTEGGVSISSAEECSPE